MSGSVSHQLESLEVGPRYPHYLLSPLIIPQISSYDLIAISPLLFIGISLCHFSVHNLLCIKAAYVLSPTVNHCRSRTGFVLFWFGFYTIAFPLHSAYSRALIHGIYLHNINLVNRQRPQILNCKTFLPSPLYFSIFQVFFVVVLFYAFFSL